ncbi:hypothetical protein [Persephonella sp.]
MEDRELLKQQIEKTLEILKQLPDDRRVFFNTGVLMVEVTKKEAEKLLREHLVEGPGGNTETQGGE